MAVSFKADILPMFTQDDIQHMSGMGVFLDQYDYMSNAAGGTILGSCGPYPDHANARAVYDALVGNCQPQMPLGGPYWTDSQQGKANLATYQQWMTDGYQQ